MTTTKTQPPGTYMHVALTDILPTRFNPRTIDTKSDGFRQLLDSIKANGVMVPVHVRVHPGKKGKLELLAGERRFRCAQAAGLKQIPAIHLGALSDEEAFEVTFTENYAREDLTPLEEGKAVATLLEKYSNDTKAVAGKLGRSPGWVATRAQIQANLSVEWSKKAAREPNRWTAGHLAVIAKCPPNLQKALLQRFQYSAPSVRDIERTIVEYTRLLHQARWDLDGIMEVQIEGKTRKAVACLQCSQRSGYQPELWHEENSAEKLAKDERCLDAACWMAKSMVWLKQRVADCRAKYPNLVLVANEYGADDKTIETAVGKFLHAYDYDNVKKQAKDATPAVVVYGPGFGELRWIRLRRSASTSRKAKSEKPSTLKERRKAHEAKRWFVLLRRIRETIQKTLIEEITAKNNMQFLFAVGTKFGTHSTDSQSVRAWKDAAEKFESNEMGNILAVATSYWEQLRETIESHLVYSGPQTKTPADLQEMARIICGYLGIDWKAMYEQVCAEIPEPKAWANLNANGTPKANKRTKK
ncbi:MAG: ParB/RepB/Spo0J family partition protein [Sedimentisphaerales bacterium]|nr:ParB/RepB/Spo0J family partition protein [Sedimentisphaerales bacterium]